MLVGSAAKAQPPPSTLSISQPRSGRRHHPWVTMKEAVVERRDPPCSPTLRRRHWQGQRSPACRRRCADRWSRRLRRSLHTPMLRYPPRVQRSRSSEPAGATARACRSTARTAQRPRASSTPRSSTSTTPARSWTSCPSGNLIRVWITADNDNVLHFRPVAGLTVRDSAGHRRHAARPAPSTTSGASPVGAKRVLHYRNSSRASTSRTRPSSNGKSRLVRPEQQDRNGQAGDAQRRHPHLPAAKLALRFSGSGARRR